MPVRYPSVAARGVDTSRPPSERYHILGRIALGGQAEIYLARMFTAIHGQGAYLNGERLTKGGEKIPGTEVAWRGKVVFTKAK